MDFTLTPTDQTKGSPSVLLWGGRRKARIIECMVQELFLGEVRVVFDDTLEELDYEVGAEFLNDPLELKNKIAGLTHFVVCIGAEHGLARYRTGKRLQDMNLLPLDVVHHTAFVDSTSSIGAGLQMMPGGVIHKFCTIGDYAIVNTNACVDHECKIGNGCHIMGSAAVAGNVVLEDFVTVGTNATILPDLTVGSGSYIGAGAVVTRDVPSDTIVAGVPAKIIGKNTLKFERRSLDALQ